MYESQKGYSCERVVVPFEVGLITCSILESGSLRPSFYDARWRTRGPRARSDTGCLSLRRQVPGYNGTNLKKVHGSPSSFYYYHRATNRKKKTRLGVGQKKKKRKGKGKETKKEHEPRFTPPGARICTKSRDPRQSLSPRRVYDRGKASVASHGPPLPGNHLALRPEFLYFALLRVSRVEKEWEIY